MIPSAETLKLRRRSAFTLIEMLIVIIIIGILMAIGIPAYLTYQGKTKDAAAKADLTTAFKALAATKTMNNGSFPTQSSMLAQARTDEPGMSLLSGLSATAVQGKISVSLTATTLTLATMSKSGKVVTLTATNADNFSQPVYATSAAGAGGSSATMLALGGSSTCALMGNGTVKCIGGNAWGQLGNGSTTSSTAAAVSVAGISTATQVVGSNANFCALLSGGAVKCWGNNANGQGGAAGGGNQLTPVSVAGLPAVASLASSEGSAICAITSGAGNVYCWGRNNWGNLGDGTTTDSPTPVEVKGVGGTGFLSGVSSISTGYGYDCAVVSGNVDCWGFSNGAAQTTVSQIAGISTATQVVGGNGFDCALLSDGSVKCWGIGTQGEMGNNTTPAWQSAPVSVTGIATATALAASTYAVCALLSNNTVKCWGDNGWGELGNNQLGTNSSTPVVVSGLSNATGLMQGDAAINFCASVSGGGFQCWGADGNGQLGDGSTSDKAVPVTDTLL